MVATDADPGRALLRWLHAIEVPHVVVLACAHGIAPAIAAGAVGVVVDGCLADVGLSLPAQLLASGVSEIRVCDCAERPDAVAERLATWQRVFGTVFPAGAVATTRWHRRSGPIFDLRNPSISRRSAFGLRARCAPPFDLSGDDAARGIEALRILRERGRAHLDPLDAGPADRVGIVMRADGCTACGVCVRACPHGALELVDERGEGVLRHRRDACRADQACIRLCPETALTVTAERSAIDLLDGGVIELARVATSICSRCGARHPSSDGPLCPPCRFRAANPFGSGRAPRSR